jgi:ribose transport system permease protein
MGLLAFLALEVAYFALTTSEFLTLDNLLNAGRAVAILAIVSVGATFGLISGALDISIGSVIALAGVVSTKLTVAGWAAPLAILAAVVVGMFAGLVNGLNVVKLRVNPIVATLAMLGIARGLAFIVVGGSGIIADQSSPTDPAFKVMQGSLAGIPVPMIVAAIVVVFGYLALAKTKLGRYAYAIGRNPTAGRAVALPVDRLRIAFLVVSGLLAGFAGWVFASMLGGASATAAQGYELTAITAVILGGVGLSGGSGTMIGTVLGVLILGVMVNGMTLSGVPVFYQVAGQGLVLLGAVALDARRSGGYR